MDAVNNRYIPSKLGALYIFQAYLYGFMVVAFLSLFLSPNLFYLIEVHFCSKFHRWFWQDNHFGRIIWYFQKHHAHFNTCSASSCRSDVHNKSMLATLGAYLSLIWKHKHRTTIYIDFLLVFENFGGTRNGMKRTQLFFLNIMQYLSYSEG